MYWLVPVGVVYCMVYWPLSIVNCTPVHFDSIIGGSLDKWNTSWFVQRTSVMPVPSESVVHPVRTIWPPFVVTYGSLFDCVPLEWINALWFKKEKAVMMDNTQPIEMAISRRCFNKIEWSVLIKIDYRQFISIALEWVLVTVDPCVHTYESPEKLPNFPFFGDVFFVCSVRTILKVLILKYWKQKICLRQVY